MLREKLDFLKPYIVRRRGESYLEEKLDDREEDDEELETEGSVDQEMGSSFGSPLEADVTAQHLDEEPQFASPIQTPAPLPCPNPQPQVTDPDRPANASKHDILSQFAEVMLADMRQIEDPVVLMRLRRDITDLVFKAVEEDLQRRRVRAPGMGESAPWRSCSWRQRLLRRKKGGEVGGRMQRWEEVKHGRRTCRSQSVQQSRALEGMSENSSQAFIQAAEIKRETHMVKIEEETLPQA
ncbi:uncharacterized protein LOC118338733 [Morone saxatilis]|uniref:uncharacterized protein LOC118338733 n=1 Tax=Morone saxatilis TaxID=34816 RepID=UPI0015E1F964|nr:uncharacterized protein LOC118338733 [Morone saxatilis]